MEGPQAVEDAVRHAMKCGEALDLRAGTDDREDPSCGATWGSERTVPAELLRELLCCEGPETALRIRGARVRGQLDLEGAALLRTLSLEGCFFEQTIKLNEARAPAVRLPGCVAPGVDAEQLETRGSFELQRFVATGEVRLVGARIGGRLDLAGAKLENRGGRALDGYGLRVEQGMFCREDFSTQGEVSLIGAHIGGQLDFSGASIFAGEDGAALTADRIKVDGALFARMISSDEWIEWFEARGEVRLAGAHISGDLDLSHAQLENRPGRRALGANGLTVDQDVYMDNVSATGQVRLLGAHVGGSIGFVDARFANGEHVALLADRLTVDQDLFAVRFEVEGGVDLSGACVAGVLAFNDAKVASGDLNLERVRAAELILTPREAPAGTVRLERAQVGRFVDDQATWPDALSLRGFTYDLLGSQKEGVDGRLRWLELDLGGYVPDAYDQLAAAYRRDGREEDVRRVRIAKQRRRRAELSLPGRLWSDLLRWTVGYGYRPWYAALWLALLLAIGTLVFAAAYPDHMSAKADASALPEFNASAYALDVLLPVVDLGQHSGWNPKGAAQWWTYASILAGWILSTAVVAALTGLLKRD